MPAICQAVGIEQKDAGSAYGRLSKEGVLAMGQDKLVALVDASKSLRAAALKALLAKADAAGGILEEGALGDAERALMAEVAIV